MEKIQMVDLKSQYEKIKVDIDKAVIDCISSTKYIKGPTVTEFEESLANYHNCKHAISCANGTDALQIALMALDLKIGDEVIVPAFTYVATAEVIALLNLKPVMVDVDPNTFNIDMDHVKNVFNKNVKAIVPVHLFGQSSNMEALQKFANENDLYVIEDNAQSIGADYSFSNGTKSKTGTIGDIGTTSFFPSKNLGCYGDGGAITTNNNELAEKIRMISNHGQRRKYYHDVIGVNSRLDSLQAAILNIKLKQLDHYIYNRQEAAKYYDTHLGSLDGLETPHRNSNSTHVFHQYTLKVLNGKRDALRDYLKEKGIPSMIYYPLPLYQQKAFYDPQVDPSDFPVTNSLCESVLSLPIHTEMTEKILEYICQSIKEFFKI